MEKKPLSVDVFERFATRMDERLIHIENKLSQLAVPNGISVCAGLGAEFQMLAVGNHHNPLNINQINFIVNDTNSQPGPSGPVHIEKRGVHGYIGMRCGYRTDIELPNGYPAVELLYNEGGGEIDVFDANNRPIVPTIRVPNTYPPRYLTLGGYGSQIQRIEIRSSNEMFLLSVCCQEKPPMVCQDQSVVVDFSTLVPPFITPLVVNNIGFFDDDHSGPSPTPTRVEQRGPYVGLHCGYLLRIELNAGYSTVDLRYNEGGGVIEMFDPLGNYISTIHVQNTATPSVVALSGQGNSIQYIEIRSANEMFLLKVNPNK